MTYDNLKPIKPISPLPLGLAPSDKDFWAAWEYLSYDAKKALMIGLPKIPLEGVGAQVRKRVRNAVVASGVLLKHGGDAYKEKHGQVDLFTGSGSSRQPPSAHSMQIAKRLMGSEEKDLITCLKRLEKVVYAYGAAGHVRLPSDRVLDETIAWAFAVRVRKPRPFTGEWLLGKRVSGGKQFTWAEIEPAMKSHALWPEGCDVAWYGWCWKLLAEASLTDHSNAEELDLVRLRAIALQHIYADYCLLVFGERPYWDGQKLFEALGGAPLSWNEEACIRQRPDVAGAILGHYKRLDEELRNKGRLQFDGGASEAMMEDMEASLPLMGDTLYEHYSDPATWVYEPGVSDVRKHNRALYDKRMVYVRKWLVLGMVALKVSLSRKKLGPATPKRK